MDFSEEKNKIEAVEHYKLLIKTLAEKENEFSKAKKSKKNNLISLIFMVPYVFFMYRFMSFLGVIGIVAMIGIPVGELIAVIYYVVKCKKLQKEIAEKEKQIREADNNINKTYE